MNTRLQVSPSNITVNSFDILISTYADSKVYGVGVA
ncbi:MAG: H-type lectin domain-containing protein [Pelatocladus maniniholoensis HA4357-MV3]|uniref:H-type lectin domain-containing protein n=1 Tax=Pelatocladus maniniholoensis HA4357-MV3 TaxID=1117104 RepID=A0A9E3H4N6_9NOST|nr:H-type lectin domain-containing protein [Pelatocladus maniniholoensis HA4357-MV3]